MLARPTRRAWGYCDSSRERGTQLSAWERELNRSEGSGMLISDPLWWGEQCWLDQPGARRAWGYCDSSRERGTQLSAWEGTQSLRRERHAHRWPSMVRGAMLARPTRRAWGYCDSSRERGTQLSAWERELNRSEGSGMLISDPLWWGEQC